MVQCSCLVYCNCPQFWDRQVWANDVSSVQGIHFLPFSQHHLDVLLYGKDAAIFFYFYINSHSSDRAMYSNLT